MSKTEVGHVASADTRLDTPGVDPARTDTVHSGTNQPVSSSAGARMSAPAVGSGSAPEGEPARGDTIGRFVVLGTLGVGGMGIVYSAYDPHLDRKVAIKLLRASIAAAGDAQARLLREAQAMAKISHPNVVIVHEVGTFRDQVYVAMEFAEGGTLREWLKTPRASTDILARFVAAGRGLGAAHAVGLIHRDFKPDNVLLTADGSVRVTDFGIVGVADELAVEKNRDAPVVDPVLHSLSGTTPLSQQLTKTGAIMGTPIYMPPEQFRGSAADARADQFSFCVALYEALYGERPFAGATFEELQYNVLSGALSPAPKGKDVPSRIRRALLRGLSAAPADRFPSMAALLGELSRDPSRQTRRALYAGTAVLVAGGAVAAFMLWPSAAERCGAGADRADPLWSAARRDKIKAAFDASGRPHAPASFERLAATLATWDRSWKAGYVDACEDTHARERQSAAVLDKRLLCLDRRLADARATVDLIATGGGEAVDRAVKVAAELPGTEACADIAALTAAVPPPEDPATRAAVATVREQLDEARGLERLGRPADGLAIARKAETAAAATGYRPVDAEALIAVGTMQHAVDDKGATATLRQAMLAAAEAGDDARFVEAATWVLFTSVVNGKPQGETRDLAALTEAIARGTRPPPEVRVRLDNAIGFMLATHGKPDEAQARYEQALAVAEKELGPDSAGTLTTLNQLGNLAKTQGRFAESLQMHQRVLAARERTLGKDHPELASSLNNIGLVYRAEGKLDEAKAVYDRALAIRIAAFGPDHTEVATTYNNLGAFYGDLEDSANAEAMYEKARVIVEKQYGPDHVEVAHVLMNLATVYEHRGELDRARANLTKVIAIYEKAYGKEHPNLAFAVNNLAMVAKLQGKADEALPLMERALAINLAVYGEGHPDAADYLGNMATVLRAQGKHDEAEAMFVRALDAAEKAYGPTHPRLAQILTNLGFFQASRDRYEAAIESHRRGLSIFETAFGKDHVYCSYSLLGLAGSLAELGRAEEAIPLAERGLALREGAQQPARLVGEAWHTLADALIATKNKANKKRAIEAAKKAFALYEAGGDKSGIAEIKTWLKQHD
jgi:tetratricopeptide (TPR) repeat protein/tRNA A-37 threonylcarbamoyl transferase component Bud32